MPETTPEQQLLASPLAPRVAREDHELTDDDGMEVPTVVEDPRPRRRGGPASPGAHGGTRDRLDMELRAGEIVGLAGPLGSGMSSTLRTLFGVASRSRQLELEGQTIELRRRGARRRRRTGRAPRAQADGTGPVTHAGVG